VTAWTGVMKGVPREEVVVPIENSNAAGGVTRDGDEQDVTFFGEGLGFGARCAFVVCVCGGGWVGIVSKLSHVLFCAASWKGFPFPTPTTALPNLSLHLSLHSLKTYQL
jgi:hypothetical protein